jgi:hypothetical protein
MGGYGVRLLKAFEQWAAHRKWWSRGESNPRPQAITGQFYMRSALI